MCVYDMWGENFYKKKAVAAARPTVVLKGDVKPHTYNPHRSATMVKSFIAHPKGGFSDFSWYDPSSIILRAMSVIICACAIIYVYIVAKLISQEFEKRLYTHMFDERELCQVLELGE